MSGTLSRAGQLLMLRTGRSPLGVVWRGLYALLTGALAWLLRRGHPERSVYVAGSFASGEPIYGLSDLDLTVVVPAADKDPGEARDHALSRWESLRRRLRIPGEMVQVGVFDESRLDSVPTTLTYGLDAAGGREPALYHGLAATARSMGLTLLHSPGLAGPARSWRLIAGPERRPPALPLGPDDRPPVAWLALQSWWRFAFKACLERGGPWVPFLCVKLIAEPIRLHAWLERGELVEGRVAPLKQVSDLLPGFERSAERALELYHSLPSAPADALVEALPDFVELSALLAARVTDLARLEAGESVRLLGGGGGDLITAGPEPGAEDRPLADWRALCFHGVPDEALRPLGGDPGDPESLAAAARLEDGCRCPALAADHLLIMPVADLWSRGMLRSVQCSGSDPVSFALLDGQGRAQFPALPGWSARDWARRSVAEHRAWIGFMEQARAIEDWPGLSLGKLLSAARAALLWESIEAGDPELPTTLAATATLLGERRPGSATVAGEALESFRAWRLGQAQASRALAAALRDVVRGLPAYPRPADRREGPLASLGAGG
jgi:predicted nucleotidyltransferase